MTPVPVNIATEDELSEAVLRRLLADSGRAYSIGTCFRKGGWGYLKRTVKGWNRAAASCPFVLLTDLDQAACPSQLVNDWLGEPAHPNLLVRVAVTEVESWLLADAAGLAAYLQLRGCKLPQYPDHLSDPKATLIALAKTSRSSQIRSRLVPRANSTAKQGPDYNACLSAFVSSRWNTKAAALQSPSLSRAITRLSQFAPTWG